MFMFGAYGFYEVIECIGFAVKLVNNPVGASEFWEGTGGGFGVIGFIGWDGDFLFSKAVHEASRQEMRTGRGFWVIGYILKDTSECVSGDIGFTAVTGRGFGVFGFVFWGLDSCIEDTSEYDSGDTGFVAVTVGGFGFIGIVFWGLGTFITDTSEYVSGDIGYAAVTVWGFGFIGFVFWGVFCKDTSEYDSGDAGGVAVAVGGFGSIVFVFWGLGAFFKHASEYAAGDIGTFFEDPSEYVSRDAGLVAVAGVGFGFIGFVFRGQDGVIEDTSKLVIRDTGGVAVARGGFWFIGFDLWGFATYPKASGTGPQATSSSSSEGIFQLEGIDHWLEVVRGVGGLGMFLKVKAIYRCIEKICMSIERVVQRSEQSDVVVSRMARLLGAARSAVVRSAAIAALALVSVGSRVENFGFV